ncbi:hypothetical protein B0T16DRAFT_338367, partial [Cercophora newfieldiana]
QDIIPLPARLTPHSEHHHHHHRNLAGQRRLPSPPTYKGPLSTSQPVPAPPPNMIFSDLYRSPRSPFSKLRSAYPHAVALPPDLDADLISKDKTRQKEAVKRFLTERIRNDWDFTWPPPPAAQPKPDVAAAKPLDNSAQPAADAIESPAAEGDQVNQPLSAVVAAGNVKDDDDAPRDPGEQADSESDAESVYSTISEDPVHFRPRAEWTSDLSDDDDEPRSAASPFRFDNPDSVGTAVTCSLLEKRARRRRAIREEASWNPGLACFEARRDAWTGAKTARVKPKPQSPMSPSSSRRLSFWRHHRSESAASTNGGFSSGSPPAVTSPLSPTGTRTSDASTAPSDHDSGNSLSRGTTGSGAQRTSSHDSSHGLYAVETLLPIPPPLLPPQNPMRASVTPSIYPSLYDKIVVHSLQPSCPVNLGDMLRACVVGWKRDGEWPPRPAMITPVLTATDLAAIRHRKAVAAQQHARKPSTATVGSSRRMSFVGFLGGGAKEEKKEEKDKGSGGNGSDEGAGKAIRRSLQKVFSLGHNGHANGATPISPTSPNSTIPVKEVTATG